LIAANHLPAKWPDIERIASPSACGSQGRFVVMIDEGMVVRLKAEKHQHWASPCEKNERSANPGVLPRSGLRLIARG